MLEISKEGKTHQVCSNTTGVIYYARPLREKILGKRKKVVYIPPKQQQRGFYEKTRSLD